MNQKSATTIELCKGLAPSRDSGYDLHIVSFYMPIELKAYSGSIMNVHLTNCDKEVAVQFFEGSQKTAKTIFPDKINDQQYEIDLAQFIAGCDASLIISKATPDQELKLTSLNHHNLTICIPVCGWSDQWYDGWSAVCQGSGNLESLLPPGSINRISTFCPPTTNKQTQSDHFTTVLNKYLPIGESLRQSYLKGIQIKLAKHSTHAFKLTKFDWKQALMLVLLKQAFPCSMKQLSLESPFKSIPTPWKHLISCLDLEATYDEGKHSRPLEELIYLIPDKFLEGIFDATNHHTRILDSFKNR